MEATKAILKEEDEVETQERNFSLEVKALW